jgi:hypothetical protein
MGRNFRRPEDFRFRPQRSAEWPTKQIIGKLAEIIRRLLEKLPQSAGLD